MKIQIEICLLTSIDQCREVLECLGASGIMLTMADAPGTGQNSRVDLEGTEEALRAWCVDHRHCNESELEMLGFSRVITLDAYQIKVTINGDGGSISSKMHEEEDGERVADDDNNRDYNRCIDGVESLILGHACAGVDIQCPAYLEGIETAVQAAANNY